MRCRIPAFLLLSILPVMNVLAAPAPDPYGILDLGPPTEGKTAEEQRKEAIEGQTFHATLGALWSDPEVRKLSSVAPMKDARPWLAKNLRITPEEGDHRLRLTFRAGTRAEQVAILNALLRVNLRLVGDHIKLQEGNLRWDENRVIELEKRIESGQHQGSVDLYRKLVNDLRFNQIPACRAEIDRWRQVTVIKWAK